MLQKLRYLLTPHQSNNHKPRALHPQAFLFYILLIFVVQVSLRTVSIAFPNVLGFATDISVDRLLDMTNQKRQEAGLSSLSISPTLSQAAANKASDMFTKDYWAHIAPDGTSPWDFITGAGYKYIYAGENLAKSFNDSSGVVSAWMESPTHKDNVLKKEYKEVGFAVVNGKLNGEETTLVVQMFGSTNSSPDPKVAQNSLVSEITPVPTRIAQVFPETLPTSIPLALLISPTISSPTPTIIPTIESTQIVGGTQIKIASSRNIPLLNINTVTKTVSLILIGLLLFLLAIDSIFIWQRKTIRVSGHNFAHMLFLLMLVGVVYLTGTGVIM